MKDGAGSQLFGRVALVVGGSQSIGAAITRELAERGARVAVNSRDRADTPQIVTTLNAEGHDAIWMPGDMCDIDSMTRVVQQVIATYGQLDILIVSGAPGGVVGGQFVQLHPEQYQAALTSQYLSRLNCLHAASVPMIAKAYGKIVFLTTDAGRTPTPGESLIGAAAAALMFFTRTAGRELAPKGVRVNCIATTLTADTPIYNAYRDYGDDHVISRAFAKIEASTPFGLNKPSDIAQLAAFLAGPESDQISGAVVSINGGLSFP